MGLHQDLVAGRPFSAGIWWIDEKGAEHLTPSLSKSSEKWFLRDLGLVRIELTPNLVDITWDAPRVEAQSLATAQSLLSELNFETRTRLNFFYHGWVHEIFADTFSAMERITEIQDCNSVGLIGDTLINNRSLGDIYYSSPRIRKGFQSWEQSAGRLGAIDQSDLANILPNAIMFRPDKKEENILFSWIGNKSTTARIQGHDWVKESIGNISNRGFGLESQNFADLISVAIAKTMICGDPVYQHIRTLVREGEQEPFWVSYERLLTRHVLGDGSWGVLCDVYPTQYVEIPLAGSP